MLYTVPEKSVTPSDVRRLMAPSLQKKMLEVEALVMRNEKACADHHVPESIRLKALGFLGANAVVATLGSIGKRRKDLRLYRDLGDVEGVFAGQLKELGIACPWVTIVPPKDDAEPSTSPAPAPSSKQVRAAEKTHESFGHKFVL